MEEKYKSVYTGIVETVDICKTISKYVQLVQRADGPYYEAKCPFNEGCGHSFCVNAEKKSFYCFGCHQQGDVISFMSKIGSMCRPTAAKFLQNLQRSEGWASEIKEENKE
jgi:DNA primase